MEYAAHDGTALLRFAVGEVRGGKIKLEEAVIPCGVEAGLKPLLVVIQKKLLLETILVISQQVKE